MYKNIISIVICSLFFFSCKKEQNIGIDEQLKISKTAPKSKTNPSNFVFVNDNDIYYVASWNNSNAKKLTSSSTSSKHKVRLSPDHQYIAYLNSNRAPVIISVSTGDVVKSSTSYTNSSDLQWSKDSKTLVFLNSSKFYYLDFPGGNYRVPSVNYANRVTSSTTTIQNFDIDASGGIVYNFTDYTIINGYIREIYNSVVSYRSVFSTKESVLISTSDNNNFSEISEINIFGKTNQLFYSQRNLNENSIYIFTHNPEYSSSQRVLSILPFNIFNIYISMVSNSYANNSITNSSMNIDRSASSFNPVIVLNEVGPDFEYQSDKYENVTSLHWEP